MLAFLPLLAMPELAVAEFADATHHATSDNHSADNHGGGDHSASLSLVAGLNGWQTALVTAGAIGAVILGGNYLTRPLFRFVAGARLRELFTATALLLVIGIALLMTVVGLSPALGTFLAGVVLASSEYRHELEADIDPFRGLLLGLFFITVGASINFTLLAENLNMVLACTAALLLLKGAVLWILGAIFTINGAARWLLALSLAQAGEFGFVLISFTTANNILPQAIADQLSLIVALSMVVTPLLFILYDRVAARQEAKGQERPADEIDVRNRIILAGRGRMGGIIERMLKSAGYQPTVIDYSSRQLDMLRAFGLHAYFGDATRPDLLHAAGIDEAKLLIIAIDDRDQISELAEYATKNFPNLHVVARAVDRTHVYELWARGCRDIVRETFDSSLRMGRSAFEALGISRETADLMKEEFSEFDKRTMREVADVYDVRIPLEENEAYIEKVRSMLQPWEEELKDRIAEIMRKGA